MTKTKELEELKPVKVDLTYLCPNDPNRESILKAAGGETSVMLLPDDGPQHLGGYITDIKFSPEKKRTFVEGKPFQFEVQRKSALWTCSTCGAEVKLDPYLV